MPYGMTDGPCLRTAAYKRETQNEKELFKKKESVASNLHVNDDVPEQSENSNIPGSQNMPGIPRMYSRIFGQPASGLGSELLRHSTL